MLIATLFASLLKLGTYIGPAVAVLAAFYLLPALHRRWRFVRTLDRLPGPRAFPIIGTSWLFAGVARDRMHQHLRQVLRPYPSLARIWQGTAGTVVFKRHEHFELILGNRRAHGAKNWEYGFLRPWLGEGLFTADTTPLWQAHKKLIAPALNIGMMEGFCEVFAEQSAILVQKLGAMRQVRDGGGDDEVVMYPLLTLASLDILGEATMGIRLGLQQHKAQHEYSEMVHEATGLFMERTRRPLHHYDWVYARTANGRRFRECLKVIHGFTDAVIETKRAERKQAQSDHVEAAPKRRAFLDLLLDAEESQQLSTREVREEVDTLILAGHDTTTANIAWTIWLLANHPDIQERVHAELAQIYGDSQRLPSIADLNEMEYLARVIKESLRLYPAGPIIGRRITETVHVEGYEIPAGTQALLHIQELHRDERYFPEPDRFDPDRFLPENAAGRPAYAYVPFGAGTRMCVGKRFAQYEELAMVSSLVREFRLSVRPGVRVEDERQLLEVTAKPARGVPILVERRRGGGGVLLDGRVL